MESWDENIDRLNKGEIASRAAVDLLLFQIEEFSNCGETTETSSVVRYSEYGSIHFMSKSTVGQEDSLTYTLQVYDFDSCDKPVLALHFLPNATTPLSVRRVEADAVLGSVEKIVQDLHAKKVLSDQEILVMQEVLLACEHIESGGIKLLGNNTRYAIADIIDDELVKPVLTTKHTYNDEHTEIVSFVQSDVTMADSSIQEENKYYSITISDKNDGKITTVYGTHGEVYIDEKDANGALDYLDPNHKRIEDICLYMAEMFRDDLKNHPLKWQNNYIKMLDLTIANDHSESAFACTLKRDFLQAKQVFIESLLNTCHLLPLQDIEKTDPELERVFLKDMIGINSLAIDLDMYTNPNFEIATWTKETEEPVQVQFLTSKYLDVTTQHWSDPDLPYGFYLQVMMPFYPDGRYETRKVNIPFEKMEIVQHYPKNN